ncbi:MAG: SPOCS domain-containing protein [Faecousia sp.]
MELQFQKSTCSCLEAVLREVQNVEQTQEIKLPDGMPDIGRVLAAWGQTILRGKEWRSDSISFSGGMMVWVLYAPEDGSEERCIDGWIPFQMKWNLPERTEEGDIRIQCLPRFVDARSVSARKLMIRTGAAAIAQAYAPKTVEVAVPEETHEGVELLKSTYPVRLPREAGEKTFLLDEELMLPESSPLPEKLIYYGLRPKITEKKVLSNKVVFRGNGNLHVLYRSEEGQLHGWDFELPFSQLAELAGEHSGEAQTDILLSPTSLELEVDDEGHLRLKCGIVGQYLVTDREMLTLVEDAYSPGREMTVHAENLDLPAILENRRENIYGEQIIPTDANLTADVSFLADFPRQRRTQQGIEMELPGSFQVLYYGEDGILHSATARWEGNYVLSADENTVVSAIPMPPEQLQASLGNGSVTVKGEVPLEMTAESRRGFPMVTGVELGEAKEPDANRPSLILRRAGTGRLWDIAKESGSTMDAIRKANNLQEEPSPGQMLLIPVS